MNLLDNGEEALPAPNKKNRKQVPQQNIDDFWSAFSTKFPGKIYTVLPQNVRMKRPEPRAPIQSQPVLASYNRARQECRAVVDKISKECRRVNQRYRDIHFDMEFDLKWRTFDCLETLVGSRGERPFLPKSVKRVHQIFDKPKFYVDGATATDIRQGNDGDCWFLSGISACTHRRTWIETICVARDEVVGVYGFVFHRDGEWMHTVIDDRLYLTAADYDESVQEKLTMNQLLNAENEDEYKRVLQTGSKALYFAQCADENETWLPLMEKAYAKAHGDYRSISGGFTGEAIEDLTGGVTTELWTGDILDTEKFWNEELMKVNKDFLFSCATGWSDDFLGGGWMTDRKGVYSMHAYSIMEAREVNGERLCKLRNPWGNSEWKGAWSDGSAEWTPEWMELLDHRFGDDGVFWISFKDLLRKFSEFDRTRLFDKEWKVSQQWTSAEVPWMSDYNDTKFQFDVKEPGRCVIVLSQLDDRYWIGLEGQYCFTLQFRIENDGEEGYIVRSNSTYFMNRSCSVELDLEPGTYTVLIKIEATRDEKSKNPEHVIRESWKNKRDKLLHVGFAYDLAHSRAIAYESPEETIAEKDRVAKEKAAAKAKAKKAKRDAFWDGWELGRRKIERARRRKARENAHKKKKTQEKKAKKLAEAASKQQEDESSGKLDNVEERKADEVSESTPATEKDKEKQVDPVLEAKTGAAASGSQGSQPEGSDVKVTEAAGGAEDKAVQTNGTATGAAASSSDGQSEAVNTPSASTTTSKEVSEKDSKENKVNEADSEKATTLNQDGSPSVTELAPANGEGPSEGGNGQGGNEAGGNSGGNEEEDESDGETVYTWVSSVDSKLDSIGYQSDDETSQEGDDNEVDDDNIPLADDPWNAICVVGLRIYSKSEVILRVIKPQDGDESITSQSLDVDDMNKASSGDKSVISSAEVAKPSVDGKRPPLDPRDSYMMMQTPKSKLPLRGL